MSMSLPSEHSPRDPRHAREDNRRNSRSEERASLTMRARVPTPVDDGPPVLGAWLIAPMLLLALAAGLRLAMRGADSSFAICFALLLGCSEPTLYVGKAPQPDASSADADAGTQPDADDDEDAGDDDDDDHVRCDASRDCAELKETLYCHPQRTRCVECLEDRHCDSDEQCDVERGDCEEL